jgi:hypothetical protein
MVFATRLTPRLLRSLRRLDDGRRPIAEVNRLLGLQAERSGHVRPSYEQVRKAVHRTRIERAPELGRIVVEVRLRRSESFVVSLLRRLGGRRTTPQTFVTTCHVRRGGAPPRVPPDEPSPPA